VQQNLCGELPITVDSKKSLRTLKTKAFPQLQLLLFVEVLQTDCQLAV
jgi:hypothetical protein